jgi:protein tyrosine phosphatase (PTP) superfamily phosphohydrolase (DUF442 family)
MLDISEITDYLYIAAHPSGEHAKEVLIRDIRLVINMIWQRPAVEYTKPPFRMVTYRTFDSPFLRIPVGTLVKGVKEALPIIQNGESVMTYCRQGRHRSVAMASCILIGCGYSANDAMDLISAHREIADPRAPHIESQILKFEEAWKKQE